MYELIIENYLNNLTKNDIVFFALKNNINLNNQELDYVFKTIKKDYKLLLGNNYNQVFLNAKDYLSKDNYEKILSLYLKYREKYQNLDK